MLWRVVVSWLVLVLTAGPSLCCCVSARPAAAQVTPVDGHLAPRTAPPRPCCCPDRCAANAGRGAEPGRAEGRSSGHHNDQLPGKHECPCKQSGTKKLDQSAPTASAAQEAARLLILTDEFSVVGSVPLPAVNPATDSGGGTPPTGHWLTAERLLDRHHQLRC